jgi:phage terminase small subunit
MGHGLTSKQHAFVAAYIGVARGNASEAARIAGYANPYPQGWENLQKPEIQKAIQQWRDEVKSSGIASLEYRISKLDELEQKYLQIIEDRKRAYSGSSVIGGDTGLVVMQEKSLGSGPLATIVEEYVADTAITQEIRAIYEDVAKELGHRASKLDITGSMTNTVELVGVAAEDV